MLPIVPMILADLSSILSGSSGSSGATGGEGWAGFKDYDFLIHFVLQMLMASLLAAAIAYHPKVYGKLESLDEVEAPKTFIMYALVAAVIGTMVLRFGGIVGFVVFGIGGLLRFRTNVGSAAQTGRVILATVIGLSAGLDLPQVAILSAAFGFIIIWVIETRTTYRMVVQGLHKSDIPEAAVAYRQILQKRRCHIIQERKNLNKHAITFVFRVSRKFDMAELEQVFESKLDENHRGAIDWEWR